MKPWIALALPLAACQHSSNDSGNAGIPVPQTLNLGRQANQYRIEGDTLVMQALERPGLDLNGDMDFDDGVPEIIDLRTGRRVLLPLSIPKGFEFSGGYVSFAVMECAQNADLDGDGDIDCAEIMHVYEVSTGTLTNLRLAVHSESNWLYSAQAGPLLVFVVSESDQEQDLDGDGLATRNLVYTYEADIGRLTPLFTATRLRPILDDGRAYIAAQEAGYGDKNGDNDEFDDVLIAYDVRAGTTHKFLRAVGEGFQKLPRLGAEGPLVAFTVEESAQGQDLNEDGDKLDALVEIRDLEAGSILDVELNAEQLQVAGGLVAIYAQEFDFLRNQGVDLNGDGDVFDTVAFFYDGLKATMTNTRIDIGDFGGFVAAPVLSARRAGFAVHEPDQDPLTWDYRTWLFDARTGTARELDLNTSFEGSALDLDAENLLCAVLQGAGLDSHFESVVVDVDTLEPTLLGFPVRSQELADGHVLAAVQEFFVGRDLNGDEDLEDTVQWVHDLSTGQTFDTGLAPVATTSFTIPLTFADKRLALSVSEFSQGQDLNDDGDQDDFVLHVVRVP